MTQQPVLISTASLHGKVALVTGGSLDWPAEKVESMVAGASGRDALYLRILPESWASWYRREDGGWVNSELAHSTLISDSTADFIFQGR
ncbi:hypothetical protein N7449_007234 [Penicillium cf. viridicatum]|uniref:Uncharacterized protein n=1 Tax=Penicillium cf. viridicatum TaxID=2972119 RepID=A0A9W9JKU7_9EURO|nr:hypothetical protein N7449_007234 [Penicillium cf. viridicatum]